ncbi:MAG: U32 family peptidase [Methanosphaera sp.]|nr:U32 family peptidase [Methanosphaera sp.]
MSDFTKLLVPAGSMDELEAGVYGGADCVYLSGKSYGARGYADNFGYDELIEAIDFAHSHNVKVYVTVNTLILNSEMADVVEYVYFLYSHGVDAVIVQDLGLGMLISQLIPDLELHASTQMTVYDYPHVKWLSENGYSNVNLSREVSLDRISEIISRKNEYHHDIDVEVFGHGALCYCYSGRCLASSFLGGRSGNRGLCAQPCRMRYSFEDTYNVPLAENNYLLSTKDLCTYRSVDKLVDAGVDSIKIEGRMKSSDYVAIVTHAYRNALNGDASDSDYLLLNLAFNRGFSGGYMLEDDSSSIMGRDHSGSIGYPIGRVLKVNYHSITIEYLNRKYPTKIIPGDGIKFEFENDTCGMYVNQIRSQSKRKITIAKNKDIRIEKDSLVYLTYSKYLHDEATKIIKSRKSNNIVLNLGVSINSDGYMQIDAYDNSKQKIVSILSSQPLDVAKNKPLTRDTIVKQLSKTGDTKYEIERIDIPLLPDNLFIPIGQLNQLRRNLLEEVDRVTSIKPGSDNLNQVMDNIKSFKKDYFSHDNKSNNSISWNCYVDSLSKAEVVAGYDYIDTVYLDLSFNYDSLDEYFRESYDILYSLANSNKSIVWILPSLLEEEYISRVAEILLKLDREDVQISIQCDDIGVASQLDAQAYYSNSNVYNNYTIEQLEGDPGFKRIMVSPELSLEDIKQLKSTDSDLELKVFGNVEIMITKDNFKDIIKDDVGSFYYLVDKRNNKYPLFIDASSHSHIYDYRVLDLSQYIDNISKTGINSLSIDLRLFGENRIMSILNYYEKIACGEDTNGCYMDIGYRSLFECNFSRGLYKKN